MLKAWKRGPVEPTEVSHKFPQRVEPARLGDVVREDCPAFAGYHQAEDRQLPLCKANGKHPDFFRIGGAFDYYGLTTCGECIWHRRFPR